MDILDHVRLRSATGSDKGFARTIHHRAPKDVVVRQFGSWDEELQSNFFERSGFPAGCEIIEFDGRPCGYMRLEEYSSATEVSDLYIDPDFQRKGIGTFLLRRVIEQGQPVDLQALLENTGATDL